MKKFQDIYFVALLVLLTGFVLIPLLKPGFIITDDGDWMVIRLTAFYQAFADGQFPVRFLSRLNNNYGYPVSNFLYPGFLYIGSFLHLLRLPYPFIIELILGGSVMVSVVCAFLWLRTFFSRFPSFIGAGTLAVSPYFLYDIYKRGSVGELLATAVVCILFWCTESGFVWFISPITALLLISHNTLALFFSALFLLYICIRKKFDVLIPFIIGVWIASFFWIPALFEQTFVRFDAVQVSNPLHYLNLSETLLYMSLPFFVPLVCFFRRRKNHFESEFLFFSVLVILAGVVSSMLGIIFLKTSLFARYVQFPYRVLSVLFVAGPWLIGFFVSLFSGKKQIWIGIAFIAVFSLVNVPFLMSVKSVVREEGFYLTNEGTTTVQDEYMPRWVIKKPDIRADKRLEIFSGRGVISNLSSSSNKTEADMKLEEESVIQLNTVFYPGWGALVDRKPSTVFYSNMKGLMQVTVPQGIHHVSFEFRETVFRYVADTLSGIGVLLYGIYLLSCLIRNGKKRIRI